jgi:diguanylate cyclase (GGDEF)-like protein
MVALSSPRGQLSMWLARFLPRGRQLTNEVWDRRHRGLVALLWLHIPLLLLFALYEHVSFGRGLIVCMPLVAAGIGALVPRLGRQIRCACVALGLIVACSILVYLSGGAIEAHFEYFVIIAFLTLYQAWMPFLIGVFFVLFEHGIVGVIDPMAVYNHPMAGMNDNPWKWAFIHAGFLLAASIANLMAWRLTEHEALHDSLTGLPNRVLFLDSLQLAFSRGNAATTAVLFIDLDNFKDVNDGLGHEHGDELLRAITARIRAAARNGDVVARLGGDEFGIGLHGIHTHAQAMSAAARYLKLFDAPFAVGGRSLVTAASFGLAFGDDDAANPAELMRNADLAMYDAKRTGGGRISGYRSDMHQDALQRANFESELRGALARNEFVVHYQPLVSVATREIVGTEALVRWRHPQRGMIAPDDFIPTAEQTGVIVPVGRWVLRSACEQTVAWHREHPDQPPISISVNLSAKQLVDRDLIDDVVTALGDSGLQPEYLCLEITESAVIDELDAVLPKLNALKRIGVSLALDDFGTGYSSLSYLRQLPVDSLKLDRSFIADLSVAGDHHIVVAIIDLAHALGLSVTAEGVETEEQLAVLTQMSSNLAQGYLLGRPMTPQRLTNLLNDQDLTDGQWSSTRDAARPDADS